MCFLKMKSTMNKLNSQTRLAARLACLAVLLLSIPTQARSFRPAMMPNGTVKGCASCHISAGGGGARTPFGNDVFAIVKGSSATPFWSETLAKKDSDGDGFTNGQELGDPEGTATAYVGAQVSNPGVATSKPVAKPPTVAITNPASGIVAAPPWSGTLQVEATPNAGVISKVDFMDGTTVLGTVLAPPFNLDLQLDAAGVHTLTAKATDYLGFSQTSSPLVVTLNTPPSPLRLSSLVDNGAALTLSWEGGRGPFLLQKKASLGDANWFNLMTTRSYYVTVPKEGVGGFYRIMDQPTNIVIPLSVSLSGAAQNPPVATAATGSGSLAIDGMELSYHITFSGLSGNLTATHIHGPADAGHSTGVLIPLVGPNTPSGVISGKAVLSNAQLSDIVSGLTYVNIHTAANGGGEIRGQIVPLRMPVTLSGNGETPPIATGATGSGWITLVGNHMLYDIDYDGFTSDVVAAHIHGAADAAHSSPPYFELSGASGRAGTLEGQQELSIEQLTNFLAGLTYVNIHSVDHGAGEIRGQIAPWQFAATLAPEDSSVTTTATGGGTLSLAGNVLTYNIAYAGLSSAFEGAHIHGPADSSHAAGVLFPLVGGSGTSGTLSGSQVLTPDQVAYLVSGQTYVNIHTTNFGAGEIRGQVLLQY
jgi:hypothetical protein